LSKRFSQGKTAIGDRSKVQTTTQPPRGRVSLALVFLLKKKKKEKKKANFLSHLASII
jgi:hypothetical protein